MKRPIYIVALVLLLTSAAIPVLAAPAIQEQRPLIAQPEQDAAVRGIVQLVGTAVHAQFQRFELYYAPFPVPSDQSWIFIGDAHYNQQPLGLLGTWDSRSVPDGTYVLRVRVVRQDGNYLDSDPRRVLVANTRLPDTPTPAVTDSPAAPPTPLPPTPTIVIEVPIVEGTVFEPTQTPAISPETTPILGEPAGASGNDAGSGAPDIAALFSTSQLVEVVRRTALYTLAAFVAVGLFFGVKALLYWLWFKIRP